MRCRCRGRFQRRLGTHRNYIGSYQRDFCFELITDISVSGKNGCGGVTVYMTELEHYDIAVRKNGSGYEAVLKLNIGGIKHEQTVLTLP